MPSILICPVCQQALLEHPTAFTCLQNHHFDKAKPNYVNLLLAHQKKSANPGDSQAMVTARQAFLAAGFYEPIASQLYDWVAANIPNHSSQVADLGCGTGYYLHYLQARLPDNVTYYGLDISKAAIKAASRKPGYWLVASLKQPPLARAVDIGLSLFAPWYASSLQAILKPGGQFITVLPNEEHLIEFKQLLYSNVKSTTPRSLKSLGWQSAKSTELSYSMTLSQTALDNLFKMTPFYWQADAQVRASIAAINELTLTVAVKFILWNVPRGT